MTDTPAELVIYFDTSFWIRLKEAPPDEARSAVDSLNALNVRYALSRLHVIELLGYAGAGTEHIVERARWFTRAPFLVDNLGFEALALPLEARPPELREIDAMSYEMATASAFALEARKHSAERKAAEDSGVALPAESQSRHTELHEEALIRLRGLGALTADGNLQLGRLLNSLGFSEHRKHGTINITNPVPPTAQRKLQLERMSQSILDTLTPEQLAWVKERYELEDAVFQGDNRPHEVAMKRATDDDTRQVRNSGRDVDHMQTFIANADVIDLFQLDSEQNVSLHTLSTHPLRKLNLATRCFFAGNLPKTVALLKKLAKRMPSAGYASRRLPSSMPANDAPECNAATTGQIGDSIARMTAALHVAQEGFQVCADAMKALGPHLQELGGKLGNELDALRHASSEADARGRARAILKAGSACLRRFSRDFSAGHHQAWKWFEHGMEIQLELIRLTRPSGAFRDSLVTQTRQQVELFEVVANPLAALSAAMSAVETDDFELEMARTDADASVLAYQAGLARSKSLANSILRELDAADLVG